MQTVPAQVFYDVILCLGIYRSEEVVPKNTPVRSLLEKYSSNRAPFTGWGYSMGDIQVRFNRDPWTADFNRRIQDHDVIEIRRGYR